MPRIRYQVAMSLDGYIAVARPSRVAAIRDWVRAGGALLLIADHAPFGSAAASLASRFGVSMGKGWTFDQSIRTGPALDTRCGPGARSRHLLR